MAELGSYGSVRGARGNSRPYRESDQPRVKTALLTQCMVRPGVASGFAKLAVSGLASMYPASDWSVLCWPRLGHLGHQCSHAPGRPNLHLVSSSRRPRLETVDRVTSSLAPQIAQSLCSSQGPFLRPGPQNVDRVARRGRHRAEHGARIKRVGRPQERGSNGSSGM